MTVNAIPAGYHTVTPYILIGSAAQFIDFLKQAFAAIENYRMEKPDGTIMHAELKIGDSMLMIGEPKSNFKATPASFYLYVTDADAIYQRAIKAGAQSIMEPTNQFYGDRNAGVQDPYGNSWWIATHIEDVTPEEITRRGRIAKK